MKNKVSFILFMVVLLTLSVSFLIFPARRFSETENRNLKSKFEITYDNFISGELGDDLETYLKDQFVFKDRWINLKWGVDQILGRTENNDVLVNDGYLFNKKIEISDNYKIRLDTVNNFAEETGIQTYFIMAPTKDLIYPENLPDLYDNNMMMEVYTSVEEYNYAENIDYINVYDNIANNKDDYLYFKTDHHWTQRGAYYAYEIFAENIGEAVISNETEIVEDDFKGTYYAKSGVVDIDADIIEVYVNNDNLDVFHHDKHFEDVYFDKHLKRYDKYKYFLDGNHPLQLINNKNQDNNKNLLVFKDSYANSFIPLITSNYQQIHIIDLRYFNEDIQDYINENDINEVLFLYNIDTFTDEEELGIRKLGD